MALVMAANRRSGSRVIRVLLPLALSACVVSSLAAQAAVIRVAVVDGITGEGLKSAYVHVGTAGGFADDSGVFVIRGLRMGSYVMEVADAYHSQRSLSIEIGTADERKMTIRLMPLFHDEPAGAHNDTASAEVCGHVTVEEIAEWDRQLRDSTSLAPRLSTTDSKLVPLRSDSLCSLLARVALRYLDARGFPDLLEEVGIHGLYDRVPLWDMATGGRTTVLRLRRKEIERKGDKTLLTLFVLVDMPTLQVRGFEWMMW